MIPVIAEVVGIAQPVSRLDEHGGERELALIREPQVSIWASVDEDQKSGLGRCSQEIASTMRDPAPNSVSATPQPVKPAAR